MARPFATGSQYVDWVERNCERCLLYDGDGPPLHCEIDAALLRAATGHGNVPETIADRMGYRGNELAYTWECPELQPRAPYV